MLKKRIVYLEQYKLAMGSRLALLQGKLDLSVPQAEFSAMQAELDLLREEHLNTLRREVEIRSASLSGREQLRELSSVKQQLMLLTADFEQAKATAASLRLELEHQKELTDRALKVEKVVCCYFEVEISLNVPH